MIEFKHKLPSLNADGKNNGTYNNRELGFPSVMTTDDYFLGEFLRTLRNNIFSERTLVFIDGKFLVCNKNWIRDNVHIVKGARHFERDIASFLNFILENQREDGQFFELIKQYDDYHWKMVDEDCYKMYPEDNLTLVRLELEADIEYLVVEGALYLYRTTGDDEWLTWALPKLEAGINYMCSDEKRWDYELGLVKRPFTIDTWDFAYERGNNTKASHNRRIEKSTPMSVMHGDNSGVFAAMNTLAWFNRRLGREECALTWEERAEKLKAQMIKHLWNGNFFVHQYHIGHSGADGAEAERLSLSNPYDINRGVTDLDQSRKIIETYISRGKDGRYFSEWFTIDPPYDNFLGYLPGEYVNGAISPFTAGELARAAFDSGYEEYGWSIIERFMKLVERDGTVYFLYYPNSAPQPERGPSAWGAASLLNAVDEGLAGICDRGVNYDYIEFSPRFPVTYYKELRYVTGYETSGAMVDVRYISEEVGMRYDVISPAKKIKAHILLPKERTCKKLLVNGAEAKFEIANIASSEYVDFELCDIEDETVKIEIIFG